MSETKLEVKTGLGYHILFISEVDLEKFRHHSEIMAERKFRYAIAKFTVPLCWILRLLFHLPLFPASCILHPVACYFFSYFLPALKFFNPGLLKLKEYHMKLMEINLTLVMIGLTR